MEESEGKEGNYDIYSRRTISNRRPSVSLIGEPEHQDRTRNIDVEIATKGFFLDILRKYEISESQSNFCLTYNITLDVRMKFYN